MVWPSKSFNVLAKCDARQPLARMLYFFFVIFASLLYYAGLELPCFKTKLWLTLIKFAKIGMLRIVECST